jgi:hypothetical protein
VEDRSQFCQCKTKQSISLLGTENQLYTIHLKPVENADDRQLNYNAIVDELKLSYNGIVE